MSKVENLLPDETLGKKLVTKSFRLYIFMIISLPAGYIIRVFLSNDLSVGDVGVFYSILGIMGFLTLYNDLGLSQALRFYLPQHYVGKDHDKYTTSIYLNLWVQLGSSLIIGTLLYFGAGWLAHTYFEEPGIVNILQLFCLYFIGHNIYGLLQQVFLSFQDVFYARLTDAIRWIGIVGLTLGFFYRDIGSLYTYTLAQIAGVFLALLVSLYAYRHKYHPTTSLGSFKFDTAYFKKYFSYGFRALMSLNVTFLLGQVDQQMVLVMLGAESAGYYTNYYSLVNISHVILGPLIGLIFPITTEFLSKKNFTKLSLLTNFFYKYIGLAMLAVGGLLFALGPIITSVFFGTKFLISGILLQHTALFLVFFIFTVINYNILNGLGLVKARTKVISYVLIFNIVSNYLLIQYIGLIGAVITTIISRILLRIATLYEINRTNTIKRRIDIGFIGKNLLIIGLLVVALHLYGEQIFTLTNTDRYNNLLYLAALSLGYGLIIALANRNNLRIFIRELKKVRQQI